MHVSAAGYGLVQRPLPVHYAEATPSEIRRLDNAALLTLLAWMRAVL